jgi:hypothetical protein
MRLLAGVLTSLAGFLAFNVIDGVFGDRESILGLLLCIAVTIVVIRRSRPPEAGADAS